MNKVAIQTVEKKNGVSFIITNNGKWEGQKTLYKPVHGKLDWEYMYPKIQEFLYDVSEMFNTQYIVLLDKDGDEIDCGACGIDETLTAYAENFYYE